jgi:hypothetical protein
MAQKTPVTGRAGRRHADCWLGDFVNIRISNTSSPAPTTIALSATLKARPLVRAYIEEQKIHHVTADQAVPQIADRAAENQRQSDAGGGQAVAVLPEQRRDDQQRND